MKKSSYFIFIIFILAASSLSQFNIWSKITEDQNGSLRGMAIFYHPDSNRFIKVLGAGWWNAPPEPFEVQKFSFNDPRWINFLPHDSLYGSVAVLDSLEALAGKWADSTGFSYGNGKPVQKDYFGFFTRQGYLRPKEGGIHNQYTYDSDAKKLYAFRTGGSQPLRKHLFTYDPSSRRWDTISCTPPLPLQSGLSTIRWGALCYDPINKELVLFGGGGLDADSGHLGGTWVINTTEKVWRKLELSIVPPPRALSPMVYDPESRSIVLFGGDHLDYLMSDTWVYSCDTRTWTKKTPAISPAPRAGHILLHLPKCNKIALLGGFGYGAAPGYGYYAELSQLELWTYNVKSNEWHAVKAWQVTDSLTPRLNTAESMVAACDTGDNIIVHVKRDGQPSRVFHLRSDATIRNTEIENSRGVSQGTITRRAGGFIPEWFTNGLPEPDTTASEAFLRNLPSSQWTAIIPPKAHTVGTFDWGTSRYDHSTGHIMSFNGGHSSYGGNQVLHYTPASGRFSVGYDAEAQLEYVGASGVWFQPPTFANRPFMPNHTWASYDLCPAIGRLVLLLGQYTYFYDPVKKDWDGYTRTSFNVGAVQGGRAIQTGRSLVSWNSGTLICKLDTITRQWIKIMESNRVPKMYTEETAASYDPIRNRIVLLSYLGYKASSARTYFFYLDDNRLDSLDLQKESVLRNMLAAPLGNTTRESVYLPKQDGILFQTVIDSSHQLFFNCATDSWELMTIPYIAPMRSNCTGLMYDTLRSLIWMYSAGYGNSNKVYVIPAEALQTTSVSKDVITSIRNISISAIPNPFNPECRIIVNLPKQSQLKLSVFNLAGRRVTTIATGEYKAGTHGFAWNADAYTGRKASSGLYVVKLEVERSILTQKIILKR